MHLFRLHSKLFLCIIGSLLLGEMMQAQDTHYSQFYAHPLSLNPALTGLIDGCYRVTAIHRNQWHTLNHPYITTSASAEAKTLQNQLFGKDFVGVGGVFSNDRSGNGALTENTFFLSGSYHKQLSRIHQVGVGLQAGIAQKNLNYGNMIFPRQLQTNPINPQQINNGEQLANQLTYMDLNAGLLWSALYSLDFSVFAGYSVYHILQPQQTFVNSRNRRPMRSELHAGSRFRMGRYFSLVPNMIALMYQANAKELNIGTSFEYNYPNNVIASTNFSFGGWFRYADNVDALILVSGVEYNGFKVGVSYDITLSLLQSTVRNKPVGTYEFSLSYKIPCTSDRRHFSRNPTPRF